MIVYDKLWDMMKKREISTYRLRESHGFNTKTIAKLRQNGTVTTQTLNKLCTILDCELSDIRRIEPASLEIIHSFSDVNKRPCGKIHRAVFKRN